MSSRLPWVYLGLLVLLNVYICRYAFVTESQGHWNSIHGQWLSLSQVPRADWLRPNWWRYWGGGAPLEFTYAPLIPFGIGLLSRVFPLSPTSALNLITASVYCLGPVVFYLFSLRLSRLPGYSFAAALAWSLSSPVALLIPDHGFQLSSLWSARRLHLAFEWDDLPHLTSLMLLPLAVWSVARALQSERWRYYAIAVLAMSVMMLANMFGVVLIAMVVCTVPVALERLFRPSLVLRAGLIAAIAYVIVSPWVSPSLIWTIRSNAARDGEGASTLESAAALGIVAISAWMVWRWTTRRPMDWAARWMCLFACVVILIPVLGQYTRWHFLPQPNRYKIEAEVAIVWIVVFGLRPLVERVPDRLRTVLAIPLLLLAGNQALSLGHVGEQITAGVDVKRSIEYRSAQWVKENLPAQRVMMAGSMGNFLNTFASTDQLSAQPYTTAPNWEQQIAVYTIYIGQNAGGRDGEVSLLWLKAFGVQAVGVSGPHSPEYWKPFINPRKFDGMLPVLWREDDTTIYRVPQRSTSLAHVMRPDQLVQHAPIHGLDTDEVQRYVAALDSTATPARMEWRGANHARIHADLTSGEIVSAQINYHPGWHVTINGASRTVRADGIGLMVIDPKCLGSCDIDLDFDGGWESKLCRTASGGMLLLLGVAASIRLRRA